MEEEKEFYFKTQNLSVGYNRKPILENISLGCIRADSYTYRAKWFGKINHFKNLIRDKVRLAVWLF